MRNAHIMDDVFCAYTEQYGFIHYRMHFSGHEIIPAGGIIEIDTYFIDVINVFKFVSTQLSIFSTVPVVPEKLLTGYFHYQ
jgi:hypothetical protein